MVIEARIAAGLTLIAAVLVAIFGAMGESCGAAEPSASTPQQQSDAQWERDQSRLAAEKRPFDIKGDRLGMSLAAFKQKYYRNLGPNKPPAPHCSDRQPNRDNPMLFYKAEMAKAGIVAAATTYPHEAFETKPVKSTIAGVETDAFIYKFVDGKLYEISISFGAKGFPLVKKALAAKFGEPLDSESPIHQALAGGNTGGETVVWSNEVSTIVLWQRTGDLKPLMLVTHKQLAADAAMRLSQVRTSKSPE